jgi:hypothetical protein
MWRPRDDDQRRFPVRGRSAHSRPPLAMHKHTAWPPACSAVVGIVNGAESSYNRAPPIWTISFSVTEEVTSAPPVLLNVFRLARVFGQQEHEDEGGC